MEGAFCLVCVGMWGVVMVVFVVFLGLAVVSKAEGGRYATEVLLSRWRRALWQSCLGSGGVVAVVSGVDLSA